jgi:peptidyl-tRNA hydrolase
VCQLKKRKFKEREKKVFKISFWLKSGLGKVVIRVSLHCDIMA